MQPTKSDVFTPRAAAHWIRNWLRRNELEYDFWRTPLGPLIFNKDYSFKCPMPSAIERKIMELLAKVFGWITIGILLCMIVYCINYLIRRFY
jgi:hypothetical protein